MLVFAYSGEFNPARILRQLRFQYGSNASLTSVAGVRPAFDRHEAGWQPSYGARVLLVSADHREADPQCGVAHESFLGLGVTEYIRSLVLAVKSHANGHIQPTKTKKSRVAILWAIVSG